MHPLLPYGIMGIMALIAGLLCILLPETRFKPTLETITQVANNNSAADEAKEDDAPGNDEKKALVLEAFMSTV